MNLIIYFLNSFNVLILKNKKINILMYFQLKNIMYNNINHTLKFNLSCLIIFMIAWRFCFQVTTKNTHLILVLFFNTFSILSIILFLFLAIFFIKLKKKYKKFLIH